MKSQQMLATLWTLSVLTLQSIPLGFPIFSIPITAQAESDTAHLANSTSWQVGEQRILYFPGLERFTLSGPSFASLNPRHLEKLAKKQNAHPSEFLLLRADRPGTNSLVLFFRSGATETRTLQVVSGPLGSPSLARWNNSRRAIQTDATEIPPPLGNLLKTLQEVQVFATPHGYQLVGTVYTFDEAKRIRQIVTAFSQAVLLSLEIDPEFLDRSFATLKKQMETSPELQGIILERFGNELWARGSISSPEKRIQIERILWNYFPLLQLDLRSFDSEATVLHFRVYLLELHYQSFREFGLKPPGQVNIPLQAFPWGTRESIQLDLQLRALETKGNAKILSQPELVVRAPGEAELFAGGEIPLKLRSGQQLKVEWKPFGLTLKLQVKQFTGKEVRIDIHSEVSQLDSSHTIEDIPSIQSNRMRTQVDAKIGDPLFLSGLLQQSQFKNREGLPFLSSIPIIGSLFSSRAFRENRSELVAILVPSLSPPKSRTSLEIQSETFPTPRPIDWPVETHSATETQTKPTPPVLLPRFERGP